MNNMNCRKNRKKKKIEIRKIIYKIYVEGVAT
jgi:hypothetical protein